MGKRWRIELGLLGVLAVFFVVMAVEGLSLHPQGRLFPWLVLGATLLFLGMRVLVIVRTVLAHRSEEYGSSPELQQEFWTPLAVRRAGRFFVWLAGIIAMVWLFGLVIGLTLGTTLFLRYESGESRRLSVILGAGSFGYLSVVLVWGLGLRMFGGQLPAVLQRLTG